MRDESRLLHELRRTGEKRNHGSHRGARILPIDNRERSYHPSSLISHLSPDHPSTRIVSLCSYAGTQQQRNVSVSLLMFVIWCRAPGGIAIASPCRTSVWLFSRNMRPAPARI